MNNKNFFQGENMAVIIDANQFINVFKTSSDFPKLYDWLWKDEDNKIGLGGKKFREEISRLWPFHELDRAGKFKYSKNDNTIDLKADEITNMCISDDPHIIGLMQIESYRLICTKDTDLIKDVKNKKLINKKHRGKIYNEKSSKDLLNNFGNLPD